MLMLVLISQFENNSDKWEMLMKSLKTKYRKLQFLIAATAAFYQLSEYLRNLGTTVIG